MSGTCADQDAGRTAPGAPGDSRGPRWIAPLERFFAGPGFPAFALSLLLLYELVLVGLMLVPPSESGFGAFAEDFRLWCLGVDPATGRVNWAYAAGMISPPLFVAATVARLWRAPLAALRARPMAGARPVLAATLLLAAGVVSLGLQGPRPARGELPFPAEALRTAHRPPALRLANQAGETVDLAELRGHVVLLTGVYASCGHTCPRILAEAQRVVGGLTPQERAGVRVVAVTLDPGHDTPQVLARLAAAHGMDLPVWNLVGGEPAEVERTLDRMDVSRRRDPATGRIDHANLFMLVDRQGRVAYRFTLGERQERWLATAVRILLREPGDVG